MDISGALVHLSRHHSTITAASPSENVQKTKPITHQFNIGLQLMRMFDC